MSHSVAVTDEQVAREAFAMVEREIVGAEAKLAVRLEARRIFLWMLHEYGASGIAGMDAMWGRERSRHEIQARMQGSERL